MKKLILIAVYALIASGASSQTFASAASSTPSEKQKNTKYTEEIKERHLMTQLERCNNYQQYLQGAGEVVADIENRIADFKGTLTGRENYIFSFLIKI